MLGRRGFALESAAARVCREAGARVSTNIFVRDLDVVAVILPVYHGARLAIDTTLVSPLRADGTPPTMPRHGWGCSGCGATSQSANLP